MKYKKIDETIFEIDAEGLPVRELLLAIANVSYDTAIPRGAGHLQPFQAPSLEVCLEDYIMYDGDVPVLLLMEYVSGRDCRTKVYQGRGGKWYLDSYAFQQRKVSSEEFLQGVVNDSAEDFLCTVGQLIENRGSDEHV